MEMRMGFVKISVLLIVIFALFSASLTAGGFQVTGVGSKAMGMSGAYRAVADDWTAAYYNPAGYAGLNDNQLGMNSAFLHYRNEVVPDYLFGDTYESGFFNDQVNFNKHEILSNPSGGFALRLPFWGETVFGLSAFQLFDNNVTWNLYDVPQVYNALHYLPNDQFSNNLDVVAFQATFGREFSEKLWLGLGVQLLRADLIHSNITFRSNPYPAPLGIRPWDKIPEYSKNDGNGYGFGLNFGMMYKPSEQLSIGLNAKLPSDITIEGATSLEFIMPNMTSFNGNYDSASVENPSTLGTAGNVFVSGQKIIDSADFSTKLKLPASVGFGLAYKASDKFNVSFDVEMTFWSKFEGFDFKYSNHRGLTGAADTSVMLQQFFTTNLSSPVAWEDTYKLMGGFSYELSKYFTVLGGVSYDQSALGDVVDVTPQFMDLGEKNTISSGFVWHYNRWDFGLVTNYTSYPDLTVDQEVDYNNDGLMDNLTGDYKAASYETVFTFNYRF